MYHWRCIGAYESRLHTRPRVSLCWIVLSGASCTCACVCSTLVTKWIFLFAQSLQDHVSTSLERMHSFIAHTQKGLDTPLTVRTSRRGIFPRILCCSVSEYVLESSSRLRVTTRSASLLLRSPCNPARGYHCLMVSGHKSQTRSTKGDTSTTFLSRMVCMIVPDRLYFHHIRTSFVTSGRSTHDLTTIDVCGRCLTSSTPLCGVVPMTSRTG